VTTIVDGFEVTGFWAGFMASAVNMMVMGLIMDRINQAQREQSDRNTATAKSKRRTFAANKQTVGGSSLR
jgi:hypothetical protein